MPLRFFQSVLVFLLLAGAAHPADVIDRIVAVVNGQIILQSQWDESVAYEGLLNHRAPAEFTPQQRKAALDRLIDQELIRQQSRPSDSHAPSTADIDSQITDIRKKYPEASSDRDWQLLLEHYGLTEHNLRQRIAGDIEELRTVDAHLRPGAQVDSQSVESYYRQTLLPELSARGAQQVPLADVAPEIREVLGQQKINDLLIAWLHSLRTNSTIRTPFMNPGGQRETP